MILHTNDNVYPTEADAEILGKEVQIVYRLFLVNCYQLHVLLNYAKPASNVGGLVIQVNWLDST